MARKRRKPKELDLSIFAEAAKKYAGKEELKVTQEDVKQSGDDMDLARKIEGTAILRSLGLANTFVTKTCRRKECGRTFQTSYLYDGYCSYQCTERDIEDTLGIRYDSSKPIEERWAWNRQKWAPPLKITPSAFDALEAFARHFLANVDEYRAQRAAMQDFESELPAVHPQQAVQIELESQENLRPTPTADPNPPQNQKATPEETGLESPYADFLSLMTKHLGPPPLPAPASSSAPQPTEHPEYPHTSQPQSEDQASPHKPLGIGDFEMQWSF